MPQLQLKSKPKKYVTRNKKYHIELVPTPAEREAAYYAALELVAVIDENLRQGVRHYRNTAGELLTTLDEVVCAILNDDLLLASEKPLTYWMPKELAA